MSQLIGKHGLEQKQAMKTSMTLRHPSIVFQRQIFEIFLVLKYVCKKLNDWLLLFQQFQFRELVTIAFIQLRLGLIHSVADRRRRNTGYPKKSLKKAKLLSC